MILTYAPNTHLKIVGAGPLEAELKKLAVKLQVSERVTFEGYKKDVFVEMAEMDILFVPSLSDAFPIVMLEGMTMGIPVVGTRVGGIPEIIRDRETGLLVVPGDSAALAEAFKYLKCSPDEGKRMGQRGRARVLSTYHPSRFVARHEKLYLQVVGAK
jgi:glycosyltransferase involved in cell wall biosynthesis